MIALACIGCLATVAGWHSSGMVRSGRIERMLRMGPGAAPTATAAKSRGRLDRGHLNALIATTGK